MRRLLPFAVLLAGVLLVGCTDKDTGKSQGKGTTTGTGTETKVAGNKHSGWWCDEHGIPEDECLMCKMSEADLKKNGNWCEHDYAKSQCFVCNPKLRETFAKRYKDKLGKEPPEPHENPAPKNPKK